ncbi:4-(cytidine 5'-diphospho)-2-C-methyl-D-erythritol kinase [bacterium]|nr:4-(cytidine 5'-diphospho)-2-C-methyl-D-erythritol kinase [bacterium]
MLKLNALSKINLCLYVLGKRDDGFHNIFTIMQTLNLFDELYLKKGDKFSIDVKNIQISGENILKKAYEKICDFIGYKIPVEITLLKNIPIGAGLGGGSSDAAVFIRGVNELYKLGLNNKQLIEIGTEIGSDVPFFFTDGSAIATKKGEIIKPIELPLSYFVFLIIPDFQISTVWAYSQIRNYLTVPEKLSNLLDCNFQQIFWEVLPIFENSFNDIVLNIHPELETEFEKLKETGAEFVSITGSGSAYFGVFRDFETAKKASESSWNGQSFILKPIKI